MVIGVPREIMEAERRVAVIPETVRELVGAGHAVRVEKGAGEGSNIADCSYAEAGAEITDARTVWEASDIVMKVKEPLKSPAFGVLESDLLRSGTCLVGFLHPANHPDTICCFRDRGLITISMDCIPRSEETREMDALASMSLIAGYKAVILAADHLPEMMGGCQTPVATLKGSRVLVVGYGVVGRQAAATARGLGAEVAVVDVRDEAVRMAEEDGYTGVYVPGHDDEAVRATVGSEAPRSDVVILGALVFGEQAPVLLTRAAVEKMKPDSVVVDVSVDQGGNCEMVRPGEIYRHNGVTIVGILNLPGRLPVHSTQLYARNICRFVLHLTRGGVLNLDDPIVRAATITRAGQVVHEGTLKAIHAAGLG